MKGQSVLFLLLISVIAVLGRVVEIAVTANQKPYTLRVDTDKSTLLGLANQFCQERATEFGLKTVEDLVFSCISTVAPSFRDLIAQQLGPNAAIPEGEFDAETKRWIESTIKAREAAQAAKAASQRQINFSVDGKPFSIVLDLDNFSLAEAAEAFCRQRSADIGVTTMEQLVTRCIPGVADTIVADLSKNFDPKSIPQGSLSAESSAWLRDAQVAAATAAAAEKARVADAAAAAAAAAAKAAQPQYLEFKLNVDSKDFVIDADYNTFTLLTTAESFCRQKAADLGITSLEQLVSLCIPSVANKLRSDLVASNFDATSIPVGSLSVESATWLEQYRKSQAVAQQQQQQQQQQQAAKQFVFEVEVPIESGKYTVQFDRRQNTPVDVAERLCSDASLKITSLDVYVNECVPKVATYLKSVVDSKIAPEQIPIGKPSAAYENAARKVTAAREQQARV